MTAGDAMGKARTNPSVLVLGSHPGHGFSMSRYTSMLIDGYQRTGLAARLLRPTSRFSAHHAPRLRKLLAYVEQLVLFPVAAWLPALRSPKVHIADHSDAIWALLLPIRRKRLVITCHDLIAVRAARGELPEHRTRWSGRVYQRLVLSGLRRAGLILAVSDATAEDARRIVPGSTVKTLHNAVDDPSLMGDSAAKAPKADYLIVVSSSGWRKRRDHAIRVWENCARADGRGPLALKIVGPQLDASETAAVPSDLAHLVSVETGVDEARLSQLYANAVAVVQTSLYEGFGWPIIEANVRGTPAICSDLDVFREVGHGAAFIDDDLSRNDWARVVSEVRSDDARARARNNADRFTFARFSEALRNLVAD